MDTIIGISVLQQTWLEGVYRLWFEAQKGSGQKNQGWIFIADARTPNLPPTFPDYADGCNYIWRFTRAGSRLDCSPSVNWISWGFHNAASWSTEYVELVAADRPYDPTAPERRRSESGSSVHYDLNRCVPLEERVRYIAELKQEGVLREG